MKKCLEAKNDKNRFSRSWHDVFEIFNFFSIQVVGTYLLVTEFSCFFYRRRKSRDIIYGSILCSCIIYQLFLNWKTPRSKSITSSIKTLKSVIKRFATNKYHH